MHAYASPECENREQAGKEGHKGDREKKRGKGRNMSPRVRLRGRGSRLPPVVALDTRKAQGIAAAGGGRVQLGKHAFSWTRRR